ncbi:OmpA family protein [Hylemonella gracilis]|uniref:OmpA family protein n=1 Tax=Hylemonella gracilis TaxID=80880 RepID=UPI00055523E7|nr:OmpA family protein [Hylemonella gracilis]
MKHFLSLSLSAVALAALSACNMIPTDKTQLALARDANAAAHNNPQTVALAASELQLADAAMRRANQAEVARESNDTVNHLAYMAQQRTTIAQEVGQQKSAERGLAEANAARDRLQLEARTREADAARQNTVTAQNQTRDAEARNRELQSQIRDLNARATPRGLVITINDVLFTSGQAELRASSMRNIDKLVVFLQNYPQRNVLIEGFTDSTGSDAFNMDLSQRRSAAVRASLIDKGVKPERIAARGYGESHPIANNTSSGGRQLNRRVEIIVSNDTEAIPPR